VSPLRLLAPLFAVCVAAVVVSAFVIVRSEPKLETGGEVGLRLVEVASGLESPTHVAFAPGEPTRLYVVEQAGRVRVVEDGALLPEAFLDLANEVRSGGEQGLLSIAFHPDYEAKRLFYVDYTNRDGDTRVVEYRAGAAEPERLRTLLAVDQPYANHNGGQLVFGPDGRLYVGMGDGGSAGDPENRAQNLDSPLGKLLRLDVDDIDDQPEIVAYGLRNPWRLSFDGETGDLWIADVGQGDREEVNVLPASVDELVNFGWDVYEGTSPFEDKPLNPAGRLIQPVVEYDHSQGCSITGGFVARGGDVPALEGRYVYGDYCSGRIWSVPAERDEPLDARREEIVVPELSSFGEGPSSELYAVSQQGSVYRLSS
jgi:glucose/arabinose dehydrogenase